VSSPYPETSTNLGPLKGWRVHSDPRGDPVLPSMTSLL
jgi:hypothetical protein